MFMVYTTVQATDPFNPTRITITSRKMQMYMWQRRKKIERKESVNSICGREEKKQIKKKI